MACSASDRSPWPPGMEAGGSTCLEGGRQVDPPALEVRDGAGRVRQVVDVEDLEPELRGHARDGAVRQCSHGVPRGARQVLADLLDRGQVVVTLAHPQAELGVRPAGLLGRSDRLALAAVELGVQADERFERLERHAPARADRGQAQARVRLGPLRAVEGDLERRSAAGWLGSDEVGDLDVQRGGDLAEQRQAGLAVAVLDQRELAGCRAGLPGELVERHRAHGAEVPDASAEREAVARVRRAACTGAVTRGHGGAGGKIHGLVGHLLTVAKELPFLTDVSR
jgi:hypothetical protein